MVGRAVSDRSAEELGDSYIDDSYFVEHTLWNVREHHIAGCEWVGRSRSSLKDQLDCSLVRFICEDKIDLGPSADRSRGMPPRGSPAGRLPALCFHGEYRGQGLLRAHVGAPLLPRLCP